MSARGSTSTDGRVLWSVRLGLRLVVLVAAGWLAMQTAPVPGPEPGENAPGLLREGARGLPETSPWLGVTTAIATRSVGLWTLLGLPLLVVALLRGRWFCRNMCPTGLIAEYAGKLGGRRARLLRSFPVLGPFVVVIGICSAVVGYPALIWLDPLSIFNGFFSSLRWPLTLAGALPMTGLLFIVVLGILCPSAWCYRICPLGFSLEMLGALGRALRGRSRLHYRAAVFTERRVVTASLAAGAAALFARRWGASTPVLRPPGSAPEETFTALCSRCGNCVRACPHHILEPDLGRSGALGLLTPVVVLRDDYCSESCNECLRVCPNGAIATLDLTEKRRLAMGYARVDRSRCWAWEDGIPCMRCSETCPYGAIEAAVVDGLDCPVVDPDVCRGCGKCQLACPVGGLAIRVEPRPRARLDAVRVRSTRIPD